MAALIVGACADSDPDRAASSQVDIVDTSDSAVPPVDDATRRRSLNAALDVRATGCGPREQFGTATVIDRELAVTAAHVVAGATEVRVIDVDGTETTSTVVFFDPNLDVAVLRNATAVGAPVELRTEVTADDVGVITLVRRVDGAMDVEQEDVEVLRTVNIETTDIYLDADVIRPGFEVSGTIDPGDSGSLVTFPDGAAGLIWARSTEREQRAWAVNLPDSVTRPDQRGALINAVSVGACAP